MLDAGGSVGVPVAVGPRPGSDDAAATDDHSGHDHGDGDHGDGDHDDHDGHDHGEGDHGDGDKDESDGATGWTVFAAGAVAAVLAVVAF